MANIQTFYKWARNFLRELKYHKLKKYKGVSVANYKLLFARVVFALKVNPEGIIFSVGDKSCIRGTLVFERNHANVCIGENTGIGGGTILSISSKLIIGNNVLISYDCLITDHNSHSIDPQIRAKDMGNVLNGNPKSWEGVKTNEIEINDNAWIGAKSIILKGVVIGKNSIIAAGSVVTKSVPENSIVAGNPATIIRSNI